MQQSRLEQQQAFVEENGWAEADIFPLNSDASFRTYSRLIKGDQKCLLMDAPPEHENLAAYLKVQAHMQKLGLRAPDVYAYDLERGLALIEDFGADTFTNLLKQGADRKSLYLLAADALVHLHKEGGGSDLSVPAYDMDVLLREADLFIEWFIPAAYDRPVTGAEKIAWHTAWEAALCRVSTDRSSLVLRDYHVDNLMRLEGERGIGACGLLDFQDALIGSKAYDLVSLVEDARLDVPDDIYSAVLERYLAGCPEVDRLRLVEDMAVLGAQRHAKVAGIFVRLSRRDTKHIYLEHIPRVLKLLHKNVQHPVLSGVKAVLEAVAPGFVDKEVLSD